MKRRIEKEINKINNDLDNGIQEKYSISDEYVNHKGETCLNGLMWFKYSNEVSYFEVILPKNYPWKQPKIFVNNFDYHTLLRVDIGFLKLLGYKKKCMCCSSILCKSWTAIYRISQVLDEVHQNLTIKKKVVELLHCRKIVDKYLIYDMLRLIVSFL
jgi:ubiquitin-protein ligase